MNSLMWLDITPMLKALSLAQPHILKILAEQATWLLTEDRVYLYKHDRPSGSKERKHLSNISALQNDSLSGELIRNQRQLYRLPGDTKHPHRICSPIVSILPVIQNQCFR